MKTYALLLACLTWAAGANVNLHAQGAGGGGGGGGGGAAGGAAGGGAAVGAGTGATGGVVSPGTGGVGASGATGGVVPGQRGTGIRGGATGGFTPGIGTQTQLPQAPGVGVGTAGRGTAGTPGTPGTPAAGTGAARGAIGGVTPGVGATGGVAPGVGATGGVTPGVGRIGGGVEPGIGGIGGAGLGVDGAVQPGVIGGGVDAGVPGQRGVATPGTGNLPVGVTAQPGVGIGQTGTGTATDLLFGQRVRAQLLEDMGTAVAAAPGDVAAQARANRMGMLTPDSLANVQLSAVNGVVTLHGTVRTEAERRLLENRIRRVNGVQTVINNVTVAAPGTQTVPGRAVGRVVDPGARDALAPGVGAPAAGQSGNNSGLGTGIPPR